MEQLAENKNDSTLIQSKTSQEITSISTLQQVPEYTAQHGNSLEEGSFVVTGWGVVGVMLSWGFILDYLPTYANITSWVTWPFHNSYLICG